MKRIYKYVISFHDLLPLPKGSKILSVVNQYELITVYALVDVDVKETQYFEFIVQGTGRNILFEPNNWIFLGTLFMDNGALVWHVFWRERI